MYNTSFFKKILFAATVVLFCSCDKDFNAIGDDLIGDDHFGLESEKYDVVAYNQEVTPVQSNSLTINKLGIYEDPVFGTTTANYNTQVTLSAYAPSIGEEPVIKNVILSIPYFSHTISVNEKGGYNYQLDSIYGTPADKGRLDLSIYESTYQMRSSYYDNGSQLTQMYYTDQTPDFEGHLGVKLNDSTDVKQNTKFFFDVAQKKDSTYDDSSKKYTYTYSAPEMRLNLNKAFFQDKILKAAASKLSAADVFQEYFRGLYFKVAKSGADPVNMALMDFSKGKITINYKAKTDITTDGDTKENRSIVINLTGSNVNLLQEVKKTEYQDALTARNKTTGDSRLYLKGGQGSLAVIELNDFASKLKEIRDNGWKVNEANLVFTIDATKMNAVGTDNIKAKEPKRVYLYDLTNNVPILDYTSDGSSSVTTDSRMSKVVYGGIINVDATTKRGTSYKIRLTNHIRNLIKTTTATNVKLGLVVMDDISLVTSNKLKLKNDVISEVPRASVVNPSGTILFGNNIPAGDSNYDKRLRLEVYYTKPN
ncbi:DUF4270 domain-containing protein [Flavobacterium sp. H4147]|uniref:DUF4270 domain-containing protein n=1 Tax=Flavobacterium sp. H4147 TaxID=3034149 RepID=UPI0023EDB944|nr:DUF4270 domain-containing protein [Flavobacterium sp. H4147]